MSDDPATAAAPTPAANPDLIGHERAEAVLLRAFGSGRLPHAWLLSGPRGIGKATLAYRFARYVLAGGGDAGAGLFAAPEPALHLDPEHPIFRRVAAGAHPDLRVLERPVDEKTGRLRSEIPVKAVRGVGDFLRMTAGEGGWRVVIVDAIDDLNRSAANALLKVLEEPPADALLLLISHQPGGLLATVRSRCCHLPLTPLVAAALGRLIDRFRPDLAAADRDMLMALADGSIGRALSLDANGGLDLYRDLASVLEMLPRLDVARAHAFAERLAQGADGTAFRVGQELLVWWLARLVRSAAEGRAPAEVLPGDARLIADLAARRSLAQWLGLWEKTGRLFARAEAANLDRKQVVLTALLDLEGAAA